MVKNAVIEKVRPRQVRIGIIGQEYVGTPLVLGFGDEGFSFIGFDVDTENVIMLSRSESYIKQIAADRIRALVGKENIEVTSNFAQLPEGDRKMAASTTETPGATRSIPLAGNTFRRQNESLVSR